jgi:hypothetical protein
MAGEALTATRAVQRRVRDLPSRVVYLLLAACHRRLLLRRCLHATRGNPEPLKVGQEPWVRVGDGPPCFDAGKRVIGAYSKRAAVDGDVDVTGPAYALPTVKVDVAAVIQPGDDGICQAGEHLVLQHAGWHVIDPHSQHGLYGGVVDELVVLLALVHADHQQGTGEGGESMASSTAPPCHTMPLSSTSIWL